jgi:acyl transferase domain-containing protein
MLSVTGRSATFDDSADGYLRGEGGGALVIKPTPTQADYLAVSSGSGVNQDGRTASLTAPNGPAQQAVLRSALRHGALRATDV